MSQQKFDDLQTNLNDSPKRLAPAEPTGGAAESVKAGRAVDLQDPSLYLNRELTWLEFNKRVLHEAMDSRTPLLERVKFAAIAGSNLDEFFMKRIGGLKQQVGAGVQRVSIDGRSPREQIDLCYDFVREHHRQREMLLDNLFEELNRAGN
ncbi:MAG: hypothetical protein P8Y40_02930, partial [Desulfobacterales bacterium]